MPIALLFLTGIAFSAVFVVGVGAALLALLKRAGATSLKFPESYFPLSCALGILWSAVFFAALHAAGSSFSLPIVGAKMALDVIVTAAALALAGEQLRDMAAETARLPGMLILLLAGTAFGMAAFLVAPYVIDSGQLLSTQQILDGVRLKPTAMPGYSGMLIWASSLFSELPVVTVASIFKILLSALTAAIAYQAISAVNLPHRLLNATILCVLIASSEFGGLGLIQTGKDSIFGILFAIAFMAALSRKDEDISGLELGLYFAAATSIGIISVPYMLAAYVIWLFISTNERRLSKTLPHILAINVLSIPLALVGFFGGHGVLMPLVSYVAVSGLLCATLWRFPLTPAVPVVPAYAFVLPAVLLLLCIMLMPAKLTMIPWANPDGTPIFEVRAPLDGMTGFKRYVFGVASNKIPIFAGLIGMMMIGFTPLGRSRAGLQAMAVMPFAVLCALLLRVHLSIPILSGFNVWDLVKDIPQWLGGTLFALVSVTALNAAILASPLRTAHAAILAGVLLATTIAVAPRFAFHNFTQTLYLSKIGGFHDKDLTVVTDILWEKLRGKRLFMDFDSEWGRTNFYVMQMFDVESFRNDPDTLDFPVYGDIFGVITANERIAELRRWVLAHKASMEFETYLLDDKVSLWIIRNDGNSTIGLAPNLEIARIVDGNNDNEPGHKMVWLKQLAHVDVIFTRTNTPACATLDLFSSNISPGRDEFVDVTSGEYNLTVNLNGTTMDQPVTAKITVPPKDYRGAITVSSRDEEQSYPGDTRRIAMGVKLPIRVDYAAACPK